MPDSCFRCDQIEAVRDHTCQDALSLPLGFRCKILGNMVKLDGWAFKECGYVDGTEKTEDEHPERIRLEDYAKADMYSVLCWDPEAQEAYWESPKDNPALAAAVIIGQRIDKAVMQSLGRTIRSGTPA